MSPRGSFAGELLRDWISQDPAGSAAAIQGIIYGGPKVPRDQRRGIRTPALVLGHRYDPVHPIKDDLALAGELADARFLRTRSIVELRNRPDRLAPAIAEFVAGCYPSDTIAQADEAVSA